MHNLNMSVTYLQIIKKIHWMVLGDLISQSRLYKPLFSMHSGRNLTKLQML